MIKVKKFRLISFMMAVCFALLSFSSPAAANSNSILVLKENQINTSNLRQLNNAVLNEYLFSKLKEAEPKIEQNIRNGEDRIKEFKFQSMNFDFESGNVSVVFQTKVRVIDTKILRMTKTGTVSVRANILVNADAQELDTSNIGLGNIEVTKVDVKNCPSVIDNYIRKQLNKKVPDLYWNGTPPANYTVLTGDLYKYFISYKLRDYVNEIYGSDVKINDMNLGFVKTNIDNSFLCKEFDLTRGYALFGTDAVTTINILNREVKFSNTLTLRCDLYLDRDNKIVIKITPKIRFTDIEHENLGLFEKSIEDSITYYGNYIKLLKS